MPANTPGLEKLFFWLGFLAASLLWFLGIRYRRLWPQFMAWIQDKIHAFRARLTAGVEETLRQDALRRAQRYHLSANLFPLEQVALSPHLMAPPPQVSENGLVEPRRFFPQLLGCLPDSPHFAAHYGARRLSLIQPLEVGVNIALVGEPGSGKSFALAYLAALIARRDPQAGQLAGLFPLFVHANDIHPLADASADPQEALVKALLSHTPHAGAGQLRQFVRGLLEAASALLLLDGIDELSPPEFEHAAGFLAALIGKYPRLRLITTASPHQSRRLLELGVEPMPLAAWNREEARTFIRSWVRNWNSTFIGSGEGRTISPLDDLLIQSWLNDSPAFHTPAEWTLKVWAACAGNLEGSGSLDGAQAYLRRALPRTSIEKLSGLANEMILQKTSTIPAALAEKRLAESGSAPSSDAAPGRLIEIGIMRKHAGDRLSFSSPWLLGFLASQSEAFSPQPPDLSWAAAAMAAGCSLVRRQPAWLVDFLQMDKPPRSANLIQASTWLRYIPQNHPNKTTIMRSLLRLFQRGDTPFNVRLNILGNIATSNDPAVPLLFRQWLTSSSPLLKQFGALGLGAAQEAKSAAEIAVLLEDPTADVAYAAIFALSTFDSPQAQEAMDLAIENADETLKQSAAEAWASAGSLGHEFLKAAASSEDLLIRRAAVYGLSLIREAWVAPLLEKLATEDTHWVVRNAAAQALEALHKPDPYLPKRRTHPSESPWLIEFAARAGQSVSVEASPAPILRNALLTGSIEEQISALWMTRNYPDPQLIAAAEQFLLHPNPGLRDTAYYILWQIQPEG